MASAKDGVGFQTILVAALSGLPFLAMAWRELANSSAGTPRRWPVRAAVMAIPQGVAVGALVPAPGSRLVAVATALVLFLPAVLAYRRVRYPLTAEIGRTDLEIREKIRGAQPRPRWLSSDDAVLSGRDLAITVRPGAFPRWGFREIVPLSSITSVELRPATRSDNPWFTTEDGDEIFFSPGDVLVIHHKQGRRVLPVYDPGAFGKALQARFESTRSSCG